MLLKHARFRATAAVQNPAVSFNATPVQYVPVNGVTLGYREFGSGEPLLMIPGFGNTINDWNETFIGILATKYHVYAYDYRGMGYSSDNNATPSIPQYADDAAGLMKGLGYESMNVYGISMGSSVSQQLVIDHPERVRKLVLDSSAYSVRVPETAKLLAAIESAAEDPTLSPGIREEARANLAWNGSYDRLSGIHKDVMLVVGTADVLTPDPVRSGWPGRSTGHGSCGSKGFLTSGPIMRLSSTGRMHSCSLAQTNHPWINKKILLCRKPPNR